MRGFNLIIRALLIAAMFCHPEETLAYNMGDAKDFWVWDLSVMPPAFRKTTAHVRAVGRRSYIFVEDKFWQSNITARNITDFSDALENNTPEGSIRYDYGIVPLEENIYGRLPLNFGTDDRVIILFADLGKYKDNEFDGFYNVYDQMPEEKAWTKYQQHSNEGNIIYLNGLRQNETYTLGVISHELQHLLEQRDDQDTWLSETLAEGAMLLSGYPTDQAHVDRFSQNTASYSLVSDTYVQYGPQILFSAFLIDRISPYGGMERFAKMTETGKAAVEKLFSDVFKVNSSFDAIFSNFLSYLFDNAGRNSHLPNAAWSTGLHLPAFKSAGTVQIPGSVEGDIFPYSFSVFNLGASLPADSLVKLENLGSAPDSDCSQKAEVLWKPLPNPKSLAIYAVGCDYKSQKDSIHYRLSIFEKPTNQILNYLRLSF